MDYDEVIGALTRWAQAEENVRALLLTGSAAAGQVHPLSDRDIEVYALDPAPLLAEDSWWNRLGEVLVVERLHAADWYPSRIVYYAGGKLDLTVIDAQLIGGLCRERPFRVLVDKDARAAQLTLARPAAPLPTAADLEQALHWGYSQALMCAKAAVREELWMAKVRDQGLKEQLLLFIEWDHRARYGPGFDTRYLGTRMGQWMDLEVRQALQECWGHLDAVDTAAALRASVELFARLAVRVQARLGFEPFDHQKLRAEIEAILATRPELAAR
ncbi:aminoglycoside 6-adenylyltransferase [Kineococcus sp. SYSU DK005]|uniref:aminoglycoside 6-adenylyltransferase n=1 Tax=Kineococcus sp. SYSU DK005 TaxID=3383126 RepID=UPI003D7D00E0